MSNMKYNPKKIEFKWQQLWEKKKIHAVKDAEAGKKNYMLLTEFPYPSGNLHIGHWYAFAVPDILEVPDYNFHFIQIDILNQ